jgi:lipopolysaccharide/colanic/teichoic acid biosynthesis glycosyltransferase
MTYDPFLKRVFDLFLAAVGLMILSPIFFILAFWIKLDAPGPVFFRQVRVGLNGKPFRIYKFRTMVADAETKGRQITVKEDPRITKSGRFLRRYKLDEFPQLINVFLGDMSLVGPRPEVPCYVELFKDAYEAVLQVKPGITDYAAIEFSNEEEILKRYARPEEGYVKEVLPRKIKLYRKYLTNRGFGLI